MKSGLSLLLAAWLIVFFLAASRAGAGYLWTGGGIAVALIVLLYTASRRMSRSLDEKENLLAHLRHTREGLGVFDHRRRLVLANLHFSQYVNIISDAHLSSVEELFAVAEFAPVAEFIGQGARHSSPDPPALSFTLDKAGRTFSVGCVRFTDGGFEISIADITQVEQQARLRRQLTQNVAHELKTPVSSVLGYIETIQAAQQGTPLPPEQMNRFLERCHAQCERLNRLVQDIAALDRIDGAAHTLHREPVDLARLVADIQQEVAPQLEAQGMTVSDELPPVLRVSGDAGMLYSIFRNLFDNAIAYAGTGTTVYIRLIRIEDSLYYFSFADDGTGVADEHLPRLFERFYRVDKGRSRRSGGTGLGLAIVRNAVALHGGTITARRRPGGGLEFLFSLGG